MSSDSLDFQPLTLASRSLLETYLPAGGNGDCNLSIVSLLTRGIERGVAAAETDGALWLRTVSISVEEPVYCLPIGTNLTARHVEMLEGIAKREGTEPLRLYGPVDDLLRAVKRAVPERRFRIVSSSGDWDYLYRRDRIETLDGRAMAKKRNLAKRYRTANPEAVFRPFVREDGTVDEETIARALEFLDAWYATETEGGVLSASLEEERGTIHRAFSPEIAPALFGGVLFSDGTPDARVDGFSYGARLTSRMAAVHIEKGPRRLSGAFFGLCGVVARRDSHPQPRRGYQRARSSACETSVGAARRRAKGRVGASPALIRRGYESGEARPNQSAKQKAVAVRRQPPFPRSSLGIPLSSFDVVRFDGVRRFRTRLGPRSTYPRTRATRAPGRIRGCRCNFRRSKGAPSRPCRSTL